MEKTFYVGDTVRFIRNALSLDELRSRVGWSLAIEKSIPNDCVMTVTKVYSDYCRVEFTNSSGYRDFLGIPFECLEHTGDVLRHPHAEILIAIANNKNIQLQYREEDDDIWIDAAHTDCLTHPHYEYRIKPEPVKTYKILYQGRDGEFKVSLEYYQSAEEFNQQNPVLEAKFARIIEESVKLEDRG